MSDAKATQSLFGRLQSNLTVEHFVSYGFLYAIAAMFVLPYIYMVTVSFQPRSYAIQAKPYWIPPVPTLEHYQFLLTDSLILRWTINTFVIAGSITILVLVVDSMIAFSLARLDWPGRAAILTVIVASFMVPYYLNIVPLYTLVANLGLVNSLWGVILPALAGPLGVFMLYQFFKDVPEEYEEAARLDGFSNFQVYTRIILPLSRPILTALGMFLFVWNWNSFLWPLIVLQNDQAFTLPIGLVSLLSGTIYRPGRIMAAAVLASIPLFVIFLWLQQHLVRAVELQGVTE